MSTATQNQQAPNSSSLGRLVARHPVVAFLILVYAFGWPSMIAANYFSLPALLASSLAMVFGLALPAFLVTAATSGKAGMRDLLGRCLRWRVGIGWYVLALLGLLVATLMGAIPFLGVVPLGALAQKWPLFFTMFLPSIFIPLVITHLFEETGWTGFMQDTIQERRGPLLASILVAPAFALFYPVSPTRHFFGSSSGNLRSGSRRTFSDRRLSDGIDIFPSGNNVAVQQHRVQRAHRGALPQCL